MFAMLESGAGGWWQGISAGPCGGGTGAAWRVDRSGGMPVPAPASARWRRGLVDEVHPWRGVLACPKGGRIGADAAGITGEDRARAGCRKGGSACGVRRHLFELVSVA